MPSLDFVGVFSCLCFAFFLFICLHNTKFSIVFAGLINQYIYKYIVYTCHTCIYIYTHTHSNKKCLRREVRREVRNFPKFSLTRRSLRKTFYAILFSYPLRKAVKSHFDDCRKFALRRWVVEETLIFLFSFYWSLDITINYFNLFRIVPKWRSKYRTNSTEDRKKYHIDFKVFAFIV